MIYRQSIIRGNDTTHRVIIVQPDDRGSRMYSLTILYNLSPINLLPDNMRIRT
jgi:hypothetical protein